MFTSTTSRLLTTGSLVLSSLLPPSMVMVTLRLMEHSLLVKQPTLKISLIGLVPMVLSPQELRISMLRMLSSSISTGMMLLVLDLALIASIQLLLILAREQLLSVT
jgi:hypothetical protein